MSLPEQIAKLQNRIEDATRIEPLGKNQQVHLDLEFAREVLATLEALGSPDRLGMAMMRASRSLQGRARLSVAEAQRLWSGYDPVHERDAVFVAEWQKEGRDFIEALLAEPAEPAAAAPLAQAPLL